MILSSSLAERINIHFFFFTQFIYEEKYIDDPANSEWFQRYKFDIPVIHLNSKFLMKHRVDEELLRRALSQLRTD